VDQEADLISGASAWAFGHNPGVEISELAKALVALGCPAGKSTEMAVQLDKRALQLAAGKGRSHEEALRHLVGLMRQGWSAKEKGF